MKIQSGRAPQATLQPASALHHHNPAAGYDFSLSKVLYCVEEYKSILLLPWTKISSKLDESLNTAPETDTEGEYPTRHTQKLGF